MAYGEFLFCFSVPEVVGGYHLFAAFVVSSAKARGTFSLVVYLRWDNGFVIFQFVVAEEVL